MQQALYEERAANLNRVMEKISQNMDTVMQNRWDDAHYIAQQICDDNFENTEELCAEIGRIETYFEEGNHAMVLVDEDGNCHTASGDIFQWTDYGILNSKEDSLYIDNVPVLEQEGSLMLFLTPLPKAIRVDGMTYTHLVLECEMDYLNQYFDLSDYGNESCMYVMRSNGGLIYRQERDNEVSKLYNVLETLKKCKTNYHTSSAVMAEEIENGQSGCGSIQYEGMTYFVVYSALSVFDWRFVLFVPEHMAGTSTSEFMQIISICIGGVAATVLVAFFTVIFVHNFRVRKQQELVNEQLRRAAEAEKNANDAKTQFLSAMSHDIRTPMNAIIGMVTLASKHLEDTEYVRDCLRKVTLASNHLLTLINDILDISKVESGKMTLNPVVFSLAEASMNLVNVVRTQMKSKGQELEVHVHHVSHEYVCADELRVNQIFINILTNAVKYTPEGGKIILDLKEKIPEDKDGCIRLIYRVQDNGIGISKEGMEVMYDAFTRATDSRVNKIQGTGLGLSICKQMVDLMGGTIRCESELGIGTVFTVILDLQIADKVMENLSFPAMQILLVDDDLIFLETASDTLQSLGFMVDCVDSGKEAVARVKEHHERGNDYPAVIVDWKMPDMDGIATTRAIRAAVGDQVPIVVISAYGWSDIEEEAREAGVNAFISKPFFRSTVYSEMSRILNTDTVEGKTDTEELPYFDGMHVLVAEDNDINWEIVQGMLELLGVTADRAENGQICMEMLTVAKKGTYNLILMDIQMPVMDGKQATREIRKSAIEHVSSIPIVAMTADAFAEDVQECLNAGMNGHMAKPIDIKVLARTLSKFA